MPRLNDNLVTALISNVLPKDILKVILANIDDIHLGEGIVSEALAAPKDLKKPGGFQALAGKDVGKLAAANVRVQNVKSLAALERVSKAWTKKFGTSKMSERLFAFTMQQDSPTKVDMHGKMNVKSEAAAKKWVESYEKSRTPAAIKAKKAAAKTGKTAKAAVPTVGGLERTPAGKLVDPTGLGLTAKERGHFKKARPIRSVGIKAGSKAEQDIIKATKKENVRRERAEGAAAAKKRRGKMAGKDKAAQASAALKAGPAPSTARREATRRVKGTAPPPETGGRTRKAPIRPVGGAMTTTAHKKAMAAKDSAMNTLRKAGVATPKIEAAITKEVKKKAAAPVGVKRPQKVSVGRRERAGVGIPRPVVKTQIPQTVRQRGGLPGPGKAIQATGRPIEAGRQLALRPTSALDRARIGLGPTARRKVATNVATGGPVTAGAGGPGATATGVLKKAAKAGRVGGRFLPFLGWAMLAWMGIDMVGGLARKGKEGEIKSYALALERAMAAGQGQMSQEAELRATLKALQGGVDQGMAQRAAQASGAIHQSTELEELMSGLDPGLMTQLLGGTA